MSQVIIYGFIATASLFLGAIFGIYLKVKPKIIGTIMAFGAGTLIAALTFGLMEQAHQLGGLDNAILGFIIGGASFVVGDLLIVQLGGRHHKEHYQARIMNVLEEKKQSGWSIVLAAILDGVPESLALGISMAAAPSIGLLVLTSIFLSNFPESASSAFDLRKAQKSRREIIWVWLTVSVIGFIFVILGYTIFKNLSPDLVGTFEALAAGALLAMIASTMIPEAYRESGLSVSMVTVLGFLVIFILSKI